MTENNYACKDGLWGHCGALGDALRRASEAEKRAELANLLGAILSDFKARCDYCGYLPSDNIVEHKIPKSRGGSDEASNLQLACRSCNTKKGAMTLEEFRTEMSRRFKHEVVFYFEMPGTPWLHLTLLKRPEKLEAEISKLTDVLMKDFGGPTENESACEMAVRLLKELKTLPRKAIIVDNTEHCIKKVKR